MSGRDCVGASFHGAPFSFFFIFSKKIAIQPCFPAPACRRVWCKCPIHMLPTVVGAGRAPPNGIFIRAIDDPAGGTNLLHAETRRRRGITNESLAMEGTPFSFSAFSLKKSQSSRIYQCRHAGGSRVSAASKCCQTMLGRFANRPNGMVIGA